MKLPKIILGVDKGGSKDFTVFMVIELIASEKDKLSIDIKVMETIVRDFRYFDEEFTNKIFEREKTALIKKYNIKDEDVI
jgi:hypothetical protein